jgi:hypothetical protein
MSTHFAFVPLGSEEFRVEFTLTHSPPGSFGPSSVSIVGIARGEEAAEDLTEQKRGEIAQRLANSVGAVVAASG